MKNAFSVIIPARNEELLIGGCLDSIQSSFQHLKTSYPESTLEIVVVLNRCTDRTEEIALSHSAKIVKEDAKNLAMIRNAGAAVATGEILVTIDADSKMSTNMLVEISKALYNRNAIGGGTLIVPERLSAGIIASGLALLPFAFYWGISCGLFFCFLSDFREIGGFNAEFSSVEDIEFARRLRAFGKSKGKPFRTLWRAWIITSCRKFDKFGDWFFLANFRESIELLKGKHQELANKVWYDFER